MREFIKIKSVQLGNPFKSVIQTNYDIVKTHGGEIELEIGMENEFIIQLPIV
jgi:hypothetical protein